MSTPEEQKRSLRDGWNFLMYLSSAGGGIPDNVQEEARRIAKHYPFPSEIEERWSTMGVFLKEPISYENHTAPSDPDADHGPAAGQAP